MNTITKQEALEAFNTIADAFDDIEAAAWALDVWRTMAGKGFTADRWKATASALDTISDYLSRDS